MRSLIFAACFSMIASVTVVAEEVLYCETSLLASVENSEILSYKNEKFKIKVVADEMKIVFSSQGMFENYEIPLDLHNNTLDWWGHDWTSKIVFKDSKLVYSQFLGLKGVVVVWADCDKF